MKEIIESYKGFNEDMTCTPQNTDICFQYKENESYETDVAEACECGFHGCEYPLDCLKYYSPNKSVYHEVEQSGEISKSNQDSKLSSTKIKIGASINIAGLVKAAIEYTTKRTKSENDSTGDYGASSATGYKGKATAGDPQSIAVAWGYKSKAKGVLGAYLVLADWEGDEKKYWEPDTWILKDVKMVIVDGEKIKPDTWYRIQNGEILECEEDD